MFLRRARPSRNRKTGSSDNSIPADKPFLQVEGAPDFGPYFQQLLRIANAEETPDNQLALDVALQMAWLSWRQEYDNKKHPSSRFLKQVRQNVLKTEKLLRRLEKFPRLRHIAFDLCPVGEGTIGVKTVREMILGDTVRLGQPPPHAPRRIDIADPKGSIAVINIYRVLERLQREIAKHRKNSGGARAEGKSAIVAYAADFFRRHSASKLTGYSGGDFAKFCSRFYEVVTGESDPGGTALEAQIKAEVKTPTFGN
jgi:hypothetical protein